MKAIRLIVCLSGGPYAIANQPFQQSKHRFKSVAIILGVYSINSCQQEGELLLIVAYLVSQSMVDSITRGKAKPLPCSEVAGALHPAVTTELPGSWSAGRILLDLPCHDGFFLYRKLRIPRGTARFRGSAAEPLSIPYLPT